MTLKIRPILLASGNSKRFGENKLLYSLNNKPIICHIMDELFNLVEKVVTTPFVVTQYEEVSALAKKRDFRVLWNNFPQNGISESIKIGVLADNHADAYIFLTGDQPYLKAEVIEGFIQGFINSGKELACVVSDDSMGSPTIFSKKYRNELLSLNGDIGGKIIIKKNKSGIFFYNVDFHAMKDIDEKIDLDNTF